MDQRPATGKDRSAYMREYYKENRAKLDRKKQERRQAQRFLGKEQICPACQDEFKPIYNRQVYCPKCIKTVLGSDAAKEYDLKRAWLLRADRMKLALLRQRARYYAFRRSMILGGFSPEDPGLSDVLTMLIADIKEEYDVIHRHAETVIPHMLERTKRANKLDFVLSDFDVPEEFLETVNTSNATMTTVDEILSSFES